jgi:hypothetical protein
MSIATPGSLSDDLLRTAVRSGEIKKDSQPLQPGRDGERPFNPRPKRRK